MKSTESLKKQTRTERPKVVAAARKLVTTSAEPRTQTVASVADTIEKEWEKTLHEGWHRGK